MMINRQRSAGWRRWQPFTSATATIWRSWNGQPGSARTTIGPLPMPGRMPWCCRGCSRGADLRKRFRQLHGMMADKGELGQEVAARIRDATAARHLEVSEATLKFGQSCPLVSSFPSAVQCALRHSGDFAAALRATAAAGGDSAGRAAMIGAWLGGSLGLAALPQDWLQRLNARDLIAECVESIVSRIR